MKTEELKALGLSDEQAQQVFALHGTDVNALQEKIGTLTTELAAARQSLSQANEKLTGYDPDWQQKMADAEKTAAEQLRQVQSGYAAERAAAGLRFSSASAKKAFMADLAAKNLPLQDGRLLGFDDFAKAYRSDDPGAFAPDGPVPTITAAAPGVPAQPTDRDAANAAFRAFFGKE